MGEATINLYRCSGCRKLTNDRELLVKNKGVCRNCGSRRVTGASPINFIERMKCLWWRIRYASL